MRKNDDQDDVCIAVYEYLFQKLGDEIYNMDVELLNRGSTLQLVTRKVNKVLEVKTYELKLELIDREIQSI